MRKLCFILPLLLLACQSEASAPDSGTDDAVAPGQPTAPAASPTPTTAPTPVAEPEPAARGAALALDGEGLRLIDPASGRSSLLAFGTPRAQAEAAIGKALGEVTDRSGNDECGGGPMEFTSYGPFVLNFRDGSLVGWWARSTATSDRFATMDGVGVGITRRKLEAARSITMYPESTLGVEFGIDGEGAIYGLLSGEEPGAKVISLWAGDDCSFR